MNSSKRYVLSIILPLLLLTVTASAQTQPEQKFDLYILIGQSNMAGRGPITADIRDEHNDRVYMFTKDKQWVIAKHPLHFDKPSVVGVGPGLTFGIVMAEAYPQAKIGLIPCAVGGTPIEHWLPGVYDAATKTHPYDDAVERIKAAMAYGTIKGVVWHQGESNSSPEKAKIYLTQLIELIQRIRDLMGDQKLPFIVGELGRYRPAYANINAELAKLPASVPLTAVATSEGLVHKGDTTHFDGPSAQELGRRMAAQMLKIQAGLKNK
jgi:hypothetical protein